MNHNWKLSFNNGTKGFVCECCNLWYEYHQTRPEGGCAGRVKYTDNDSLRPPVNETAKRELGHDLKDYNWSDK